MRNKKSAPALRALQSDVLIRRDSSDELVIEPLDSLAGKLLRMLNSGMSVGQCREALPRESKEAVYSTLLECINSGILRIS